MAKKKIKTARKAAPSPRRMTGKNALAHFAPPFGAADAPIVPPWRWLWFLMLAGFLLRFGLGLTADWMYRTDEYIQYLEQAHRVVFGYGHIPWEYRLGVRNWMISAPAIATLHLCKVLGLTHPDYYVPAVKAANSALSMLLPLGMYFFVRRQYSEMAGRAALLAGLLWYEMLIFAPRVLSEQYAAILIFAALGLAAPRGGVGRALLGGFLFGLALSLRLPFAPVVGLAGLAWLVVLPWWSRAALVIGGVAALLLWGAVDYAIWGGWWESIVNYVAMTGILNEQIDAPKAGSLSSLAYLQFLTVVSLGVFPVVFLMACASFRRHWLLLALIGGLLLVHLSYAGGVEYSNIIVAIPLFLCLAAALFGDLAGQRGAPFFVWRKTIIAGVALITLAGGFAALPYKESAYPLGNRYFFYQAPFFAASEFLSRQSEVRTVVYKCGDPFASGGYYRLHHNVPVLSLAFPDQAELLKGKSLRQVASHIIACDAAPIDGFSEAANFSGLRIYANNNPAQVEPPQGFLYDVYHPYWARLEKYMIEQGMIKNPRPPTPLADVL